MTSELDILKKQYDVAKVSFRSAMIRYEIDQDDESERLFEEEKAKMRGIFTQMEQLNTASLAKQNEINQQLQSQLSMNSNDEEEYTQVYQQVSSRLDKQLASYPLLLEVQLRQRIAYLELGFILAGILVAVIMLGIHSQAKPSEPIKLPNAQQVQQQVQQVQKKTQEVGKNVLNYADKAVVAGKQTTDKVYNRLLDAVFGKTK